MARSLEAQQFHSLIIQFINGDLAGIECIEQKLSRKNDRGFILETSVNGHSHLMDILHLSFVIPNSLGKTSSEVAHTLYDLFKTYTTALEWQELLFKKCDRLFYPLQQALISGDLILYKKCEQAYRDVLKNKPKAEYDLLIRELISMLINNNSEGYNALHSAIGSKSLDILEFFLAFLQDICESFNQLNLVTKYDLLSVLLSTDDYQNNPVQIAIFHQNNLVLKKIIIHLFSICPTQKIRELHDTLTTVNTANLNILMLAVQRQDISCLKTVFNVLKSDAFNRPQYKQILLSQHQYAYSPCHMVLKTQKLEIFELFYKELNDACESKLISVQEMSTLFLKNGTHNLPLLYNALLAKPEIFKFYFACINQLIEKKILSQKQWRDALTSQDYSGKSVWAIALHSNAPTENLIDCFKILKELMKSDDEISSLADLSILGFNLIDEVIMRQDLELFKLYFDYLLHVVQNHKVSYQLHQLFYSDNQNTALNSLIDSKEPEFLSYFFSKLPDKKQHLPNILKASEYKNSVLYNLLQNHSLMLKTFLKEIKKGISLQQLKQFLTETTNDDDINPLFHVLENSDIETIQVYFEELGQLQLSSEEQLALLLPKKDNSALMHCVRKCSTLSTTYLFEYIFSCPQKNQIIESVDYQTLFNHHNSPELQFFENYLIFISSLMKEHKNFSSKIKSGLMPHDFSCKTLLIRVIETKNDQLLKNYFDLLSKAIELKIITKDEYKNYILSANFLSARPLSIAIATQNPDLFTYYWKRISAILKKSEEFSSYILETNLISAVSFTGNFKMTEAVFDSLAKLFEKEPKKLYKLLNNSCFYLTLTNHQDQKQAALCLDYLEEKKSKLEPKYATFSNGFFDSDEHHSNNPYTFVL